MSDADTPRVTLLAIDDDPKSLELIRDALSRDDLTILTSTDPRRVGAGPRAAAPISCCS